MGTGAGLPAGAVWLGWKVVKRFLRKGKQIDPPDILPEITGDESKDGGKEPSPTGKPPERKDGDEKNSPPEKEDKGDCPDKSSKRLITLEQQVSEILKHIKESEKKGGSPDGEKFPDTPLPRKLDETRQLLQLRQLEGRVAPLDALRGMVIDDELKKSIESEDENRAEFARKMKDQLDDRINQIAPVATGEE